MNEGKSWIHARPPLRYRCTVCHKTGSERAGAPFYRRPPAEAIITLVVTLVAHEGPIAAIVAACGFPRQTVAEWTDAAGVQCAAVDQPGGLPSARPRCGTGGREPGHASVGIVWVALTMPVATRRWLGRWLGGAVSPRRNRARLASLARRTRAGGRTVTRVEWAGTLWAGWLVGTGDNCCPPHRSLAQRHTPAMAAGITDHVWRRDELLPSRVPPTCRHPPKEWGGRRTKAEAALSARWAA